MFKPGYMVRCNINNGYEFLKKDELYCVEAVQKGLFGHKMLRLTGSDLLYCAARFEPWPNPWSREHGEPWPAWPFKTGDVVKARLDCNWQFKKGDKFTVSELQPGIVRLNGSTKLCEWYTWELFERTDSMREEKEEEKTMEPCKMNAAMPPRLKAMISQPMAGRKKIDILNDREGAERYLRDLGYDVVNTVFELKEFNPKSLVYSLSMSIQEMSRCDVVFFMKGWHNARGCKIEHEIAEGYGLNVMYEGGSEEGRKFKELREAAAPLVEYMNQNYCPHDMAIVRQGGVEIVSGQMSISFPVRD